MIGIRQIAERCGPFVIRATAVLAFSTASDAMCLGTNCPVSLGVADVEGRQQQLQALENYNQHEMAPSIAEPVAQGPVYIPEGPGLIETLIGLSQQSELHEK